MLDKVHTNVVTVKYKTMIDKEVDINQLLTDERVSIEMPTKKGEAIDGKQVMTYDPNKNNWIGNAKVKIGLVTITVPMSKSTKSEDTNGNKLPLVWVKLVQQRQIPGENNTTRWVDMQLFNSNESEKQLAVAANTSSSGKFGSVFIPESLCRAIKRKIEILAEEYEIVPTEAKQEEAKQEAQKAY